MKTKKGILVKNLVGLILSAVIVFGLIMLLFNLFAPSFDRGDKTAESYFENLNRAIKDTDAGGEGDFFMQDYGDEELRFYLTYFGNVASFENAEKKNFIRSKEGDKIICICYLRGGSVVCNYCEDLKSSASVSDGDEDSWAIEQGENIKITKSENGEIYEFSKIK